MKEKDKEFQRQEIITPQVFKQSLVVLGAAVSLGFVILPLTLSKLYDKLEIINNNVVQLATLQVRVNTIERYQERDQKYFNKLYQECIRKGN